MEKVEDVVEKVMDVDLSRCKIVDECDTGDGLRITFYEQEDGSSLLNLDWDEDSRWGYLKEDDFVESFNRMLIELIGEEEGEQLMEGVAVVPVDEWREIEEKLGKETVVEVCEIKQESSGDGGSDPVE